MDSGSEPGGILKLRELIEEHPAEIAYDFRIKFGLSVEQISYTVSYGEAVMLVSMLLRDPSSWLQAAVNRWKYPVSPEWMVMANLFDLTMAVNSKNKPKPMDRPWPKKNDGSRIGDTTTLSQDKIREILDDIRTKEENTDG